MKYLFEGNVTECVSFQLKDPMYNQMIAENGCYAIRTGTCVYVSKDLRKWLLIYNDKRAISKSMAFVKNKKIGQLELLFSEYTPGKERFRHHIYKYNLITKQLKQVFTFYKVGEGKIPIARHIHILDKDPYTGDIWVGTGDTDDESAIYRSTDSGETFQLIGMGNQKWRMLAFIFTSKYIFWNVDSHEPQYLTRISREDSKAVPISESI